MQSSVQEKIVVFHSRMVSDGSSVSRQTGFTAPGSLLCIDPISEIMFRLLFSGLTKVLGKRTLVITRSSFPSLGQYGGHWTGDIWSSWNQLYFTIPGELCSKNQVRQCVWLGTYTVQKLCIAWNISKLWLPQSLYYLNVSKRWLPQVKSTHMNSMMLPEDKSPPKKGGG